ncbi:hypothetical protein GQ53DRAFT_821404 [Thozetella sp. PMI_491]|nr:hypothetical protein GQ53DRAFT_821404 [Thozetella sp. PMI_491]
MRGIRTALKYLPKDLDETYQRIFSYVGEGEKELVRHALRWISFHYLVWGKGSVRLSPQILRDSYILSSTESRVQLTEDGENWCDIETIKDSCGCLVTFYTSEVLLAHYTVREFIESPRATSGYAEFFSSNFGDYSDFSALMFRHAPTWDISVDYGSINHSTIELLVSTNISIYYLASGLAILHNRTPMKIEEQDLLYYLDSRSPHCDHLYEIAFAMVNGFYGPDILFPKILDSSHRVESAMLSLIWMRRFDLALMLLPSTDASRFSDIRLTFRLESVRWWNLASDIQWEIAPFEHACSLVGLAVFAPRNDIEQLEALDFLNQLGHELNDPTILLHSFISQHSEHNYKLSLGRCSLREVLTKGADANGKGFRVTPLQIAVMRQDLEAIKVLLEFGANVNWVGESGGTISADPFGHLHGKPPLRIVREMRILEDDDVVPEIERILLASGGEDNSSVVTDHEYGEIFGPYIN